MDENKDYFKIREKAGGYFSFDGAFDNNKEIANIIIDRDNSIAVINYSDGYYFSVSATITQNGNNFTITNIKKAWGKNNGND